jgi:hypothetical protein
MRVESASVSLYIAAGTRNPADLPCAPGQFTGHAGRFTARVGRFTARVGRFTTRADRFTAVSQSGTSGTRLWEESVQQWTHQSGNHHTVRQSARGSVATVKTESVS